MNILLVKLFVPQLIKNTPISLLGWNDELVTKRLLQELQANDCVQKSIEEVRIVELVPVMVYESGCAPTNILWY